MQDFSGGQANVALHPSTAGLACLRNHETSGDIPRRVVQSHRREWRGQDGLYNVIAAKVAARSPRTTQLS